MTRTDVKVGDKVRVVNAWEGESVYKNGDVLEVIALSKLVTGSVWVRTEKPSDHGVSFCDREISEPYAYLCSSEYEPCEPIKVGDTVTLIDNFYNHEKFKAEPRIRRKSIASLDGDVFNITHINFSNRASTTSGIVWSVPLDLLRKVEPRLDGKNFSYLCIDEITTLHRHTPEQIAEAQRIIGEIVAGFKFGQCFYIRDESDRELTIRYTAETADGMHTVTAHCSPHDEFNRTIGIMVALCKATGRKLPDWI